MNVNDRVVSEFNNVGTVLAIAPETVTVKWDGYGTSCTLSRHYVENLERLPPAPAQEAPAT